jgi:hypothetical protein
MDKPNHETRTTLLVLALIAAFEIFRPAPAMTQQSMNEQLRDVACSNPASCDDDGVCQAFREGCVCDDCTTHPECLN